MRVARCPVRITKKSQELEDRRRRVARAYRNGVPIPLTTKQLGVSERTIYRDRREIRTVWVAQVEQLAQLWDPVSVHQERMQRVLEATWGVHAAAYTRLRDRLRHVVCERRAAIEGPPAPPSLAEIRARLGLR
jgi:hypothetical protein